MSRVSRTTVKSLIDAQEVGGFALPEELTRAFAALETLTTIPQPDVPPARVDAAASQLLDAADAGTPIDLVAVGKRMHAEQVRHDAAQLGWRVLQQAVEQAGDRLDALTQDLADIVITEHLRPAFEETLTLAREQADVLGDQPLDVMSLMGAPAAVRDAYAWLVKLDTRLTLLRHARTWVNSAGHRTPQHDGNHEFATLRRTRALFPGLPDTANIPRDWGVPKDDPVQRILWWTRDATPAEPWLPTVAEQDTAWLETYGDAVERLQRNSHNAHAYGSLAAAPGTGLGGHL